MAHKTEQVNVEKHQQHEIADSGPPRRRNGTSSTVIRELRRLPRLNRKVARNLQAARRFPGMPWSAFYAGRGRLFQQPIKY
jgi:hypothetical protein